MTIRIPLFFVHRLCLIALAGSLSAAVFPAAAPAQDLDTLIDEPAEAKKGDALGELVKEIGGGTLFRLVPVDKPDQGLTNRVYWRRFQGSVAAQTTPVTVKLDGKPVISPKAVQNETTLELGTSYPVEGHILISAGQHTIQPGSIPLKNDGALASDHPAVRFANDEVRILCAPVRLDAVDANGIPAPTRITVACGDTGLLREEATFNPLVIWLPVGVQYKSSLGPFEIAPDGKIKADPAELEANVRLTPEGLRLTVNRIRPPSEPLATIDATRLTLISHRKRTVFAQGETATFAVIVPRGHAGGEARIALMPQQKDATPVELGKLVLPAVKDSDFDSRLFHVSMSAIPTGVYEITVAASATRSPPLPLTVVPWYKRSAFFTHTMSGCTDLWPNDDSGLQLLHDSGLEMATGTGFTGLLDAAMPRIDPGATAAALDAGLPPETAVTATPNDLFLERCMRHQMPIVDMCVVRAAPFYNESLSYHHSYKPSVDRMIRRMQVFAQQTADYPSFWGVNYSWFPALFGYTEGGVPTDAHTVDRNAALADNLARAGYTNATREELEWYEKNKFADSSAAREKAQEIARKAVRYWKAQMDFGFGRHNKLYNDAVRQVRPDLACTLFENAGHDLMKRTRSLFNDMNASCYESYTDYGEWAMSAGFTTDWARGNAPGRPVWLTTDWGTSSEGSMKSLFHAVARGLAGGGVTMEKFRGPVELAHRGKGLRFVSQYGAIPARATPDNRFAILVTDAEQVFDGRAQYAYHAVYYHLTRLGYPPVLIDEETVAVSGIPGPVKALFIVRQTHSLEPKVTSAIDAFAKRGGKVVATADSLVKPAGCLIVDAKVKHIWMLSGFEWKAHTEMWEEFETNWRAPLSKTLADLAIPAFATTDPERGLVLGMEAGAVRYAVVIADRKNTHYSEFEDTEDLPVSLEGAGWIVRDLAKQVTLPATVKDGRTLVSVDLITEPATILALYKAAPDKLAAETAPSATLGAEWRFSATVFAGGSGMGPVPVSLTLKDPRGKTRLEVYRGAGDIVSFVFPVLDMAGVWTLSLQEQITGLAADLPVTVAAAPAPATPAVAVPDVHIVNLQHLYAFAAHAGEKAVIVEPGQPQRLPLAKKIADGLNAAGIKARVWQVRPEEFDTIPMRYYPRPEDTARLDLIDAGKLIGWRENMRPLIDTTKRANVPERGGVTEIDPLYMLGTDAIVFSGGPLAESLRAVTPWMNTPNVPGRGQGRLLTVLSPFTANRHVTTVIANDDEGMARAADRLVAVLAEKPATPPAGSTPPPPLKTASLDAKPAPVNRPFLAYTPLRRVQRVLATADGKAAVLIKGKKDTVAFVDESGKLTATVAVPAAPQSGGLDSLGRLWACMEQPATDKKKTHDVRVLCIRPDGTAEREVIAFADIPSRLGALRGEAAFPISPDGKTAAFGRLGGPLLGDLAAGTWKRFDDMAHVRKTFEVWTPRFPTAMTFSPDGCFLFFTMDSRPTGYENMHQQLNRNEGGASFLIDASSGQVLWQLRAEPADYSCANGFAAVARDGAVTALFDVWNRVAMVDKAGKVLAQEFLRPKKGDNVAETKPAEGVGCWINPGGTLAAFATAKLFVLGDGKTFRKITIPDTVSAAVLDDGPLAIAGLLDGRVVAYTADGTEAWTVQSGGVAPQVASAGNRILVGTSEGELVTLDSKGKELRRVNVVQVADKERHEPKPGAGVPVIPLPTLYPEPDTLKIAVERLQAGKAAEWKPEGQGTAAFGRTFHPVNAPVELAAPAEGEAFLHLVYRRPADNRKLTVSAEHRGKTTEFVLDLPTPLYRVVDLPVKGGTKIAVRMEGPIEIAECALYSFTWPGPSLVYVRPPDQAGPDSGDLLGGGGGDDDLNLDEDGGGAVGKMKETRIWSPNPDIDQVQGLWMSAPNGYLAVNGQRWDLGSWSGGKKFIGEWLTQKMGQPVQVSMAAAYDSSRKQSEVTERFSVFQNELSGERAQGGDVLGAAIDNDQFWRLFSFKPVKTKTLGAYVYTPGPGPEGLSEVEFYR